MGKYIKVKERKLKIEHELDVLKDKRTPRNPEFIRRQICKAIGDDTFDPLVEVAKQYKEVHDPNLKLSCLQTLARYMYPQLKAVEHNVQSDVNYNFRMIVEPRKKDMPIIDVDPQVKVEEVKITLD